MVKMKTVKWLIYSVLLAIGLLLNFNQNIIELYMRFMLRNEHIVISFSTTPHRINNIDATISTVLHQNIKVDAIYVAIPYIFKRDNIPYIIPEWLANNPHIKIIRSEDYGPATKLLGVLAQVPLDPATIIITVDDDIKYPKNAILQLAYKAKQYPRAAIGLAGADPIYNEHGILISNKIGGFTRVEGANAKATILQGFAGIAYRRNFFRSDIFAIANAPRDCINCDDVYLSFYLAKENVNRQVLHNRFIDKLKVDYNNQVGLQSDALHQMIPSPSDKHRSCIAYLKGLYPNVKF